MADDKTERATEPAAITSISVGPRIAPDAHVVHYETETGEQGYARMRRPAEGATLLPGERVLDMGGRDAHGRIMTRELFRNGPAQVASKEYRDGWDAIFAKKREVN